MQSAHRGATPSSAMAASVDEEAIGIGLELAVQVNSARRVGVVGVVGEVDDDCQAGRDPISRVGSFFQLPLCWFHHFHLLSTSAALF